MKRTTRQERGRFIAQARDRTFLALKNATFDEAERAYLALEKELLRMAAATPWERQEVKRAIADDIFSFAFGGDVTWPQVARSLRRIERLGYSDLWTRVHVAHLFIQMVPRFPDKARKALAMLEEAERRVLRVRRGHPSRKEGLRAIAHARQFAARAGITPPTSGSGR
jgi:hypothetical protein